MVAWCRRRDGVGVSGVVVVALLVEVVFTMLGCLVAVTSGVRSTLGVRSHGAHTDATASPDGFRVEWDPSASRLRRLTGPLVYIVREWDGDRPEPFVKIGWTGTTTEGAVARRLGDWETGSRFPLRVEAVVPSAPQSLERGLHRALGSARTSKAREWFDAPRDDGVWREIVEATCKLHRPVKGEEVPA